MAAAPTGSLPALQSVAEAVALSIGERADRRVLLEGQLALLRAAENAGSGTVPAAGLGDQVREEPSLDGRSLFGSAHFSDSAIVDQLLSRKYQLDLAAHAWPALEQQGPCFQSLAREVKAADGATGGSLAALAAALEAQPSLHAELRHFLTARIGVLAASMREIAESYLARSLPKPAATGDKTDNALVSKLCELKGNNGIYRPVNFIKAGSAGLVYSAVSVSAKPTKYIQPAAGGSRWEVVAENVCKGGAGLPSLDISTQVVLKKINATQKDSAENEYRIASKLATNNGLLYCIPYVDRIVEEDTQQLWLVLQRVNPSAYGIDLNEYISSGFFQKPAHAALSRIAVLQILAGLAHAARLEVVMRDVKPDNVLVELTEDTTGEHGILARWSDFGLAVDLSEGGSRLRRPRVGSPDEEVRKQLVGWWYDTQKQVPKPKWENRCPPERCYQADHAFAFDMYMAGIIIVCIATGIDFPHLGTPAINTAVVKLLGTELPKDYLSSFELGQVVADHSTVFSTCFAGTFGKTFGAALLVSVKDMLAIQPSARPTAEAAHASLSALL